MAAKRRPPRDFARYGTIEAVNVVLVPAAALYLASPTDWIEAVVMAAGILSASALLIVGAVYWHALSRRLKGDRALLQRWLIAADRAQRPLLILVVIAAAACAAIVAARGLTWPVVAALALTALAALEYVNYYHRQLQHFDNWSDFRRLLTTGRLRPAHSAKDLAAYRKSAPKRSPVSTSGGGPART